MSEETVVNEGNEEIIEAALEGEVVDEVPINGLQDSEVEEETAAAEEPPSIEEQLAAAQAEAADYKDRWLRGQAEFANARKRMDRQRIELYANATADVMKKLLPAVDDFDRAMENLPEEISQNSWLEGIQLVQKKLTGILESTNAIVIEAVGQPFDPNLHEAISQEPSDEYESGIVCREILKGYKIGDRVIRPSLVSVAQ
ncbi:MAG: nucleotide exchange factor GrpE [Chloroflexi bacterium]|nr:nucleotide exchange factor GrpE [Chloroflexota bacterium]